MPDLKRIWNLRLNLDEFNALAAGFYTDEDRSLAFQGVVFGANGGLCSGAVPEAFERGYKFGLSARQEADNYRLAKHNGGLASAATRKERYGTAQPKKETSEHNITSVRTDPRTQLEQTPNQSSILNLKEKDKDVDPPAEVPTTKRLKKASQVKAPKDTFEEILGTGTLMDMSKDFWELSRIWPEGSNIKKKDSARAYVEARKEASHECIFAWAEWTLKETQGKITTLAAWLSNQDWQGRQERYNIPAANG